MNILFFGNTKFSVIDAKALHEAFGLTAIVTIPDKPVGRKQILTPSPTKVFAQQHNISVIEADKLTPEIIDTIQQMDPDFLVVADYGLILPKSLLAVPHYDCLNIHHSLLPKYRGPSPAQSAILAGEKVSGVTVIAMNEAVDAGDMLAQQEYVLAADETTESLLSELNTLGGKLVVDVIHQYRGGVAQPLKQNENEATFTKRISKEDGSFDATNPPEPEILDRMIRAYYPWPTVFTRLHMANGKEQIVKFLPGEKIQVEGKNIMSVKDFLNGYPDMKETMRKLLNF